MRLQGFDRPQALEFMATSGRTSRWGAGVRESPRGAVEGGELCSLLPVQPVVASISPTQAARLVSHYISPSSLSHPSDSGGRKGGEQKTEEELRGDWILSDARVVTLLQSRR